MRRNQNCSGFTVMELLISITIMALIFIVLFSGVSQNLDSMVRGDEEITMQGEVSRIMAEIYLELTSLNPCPEVDKDGNVWLMGEKDREVQPNLILFTDRNVNPDDGGEELSFTHFGGKTLADRTPVRFFFQPDPEDPLKFAWNKDKTGHILIKKRGDRTNKVSDRVESIHFSPEDGPLKSVRVKGVVALMSPRAGLKRIPFEFSVRLESMYLAFRSE